MKPVFVSYRGAFRIGSSVFIFYLKQVIYYPAKIYSFKFNNKSTRKWCEIVKIFKVNNKTPEDAIDVVLVFLPLTLNIFHTFF